jgi:hypothetical protein
MLSLMHTINQLKLENQRYKIKILELLDEKKVMSISEYELYVSICNKLLNNPIVLNDVKALNNNVKSYPNLPESDEE